MIEPIELLIKNLPVGNRLHGFSNPNLYYLKQMRTNKEDNISKLKDTSKSAYTETCGFARIWLIKGFRFLNTEFRAPP